MKNCRNCRKKDCEFRGVKYENLTIYCREHCAKELKEECDKIATKEFREVIECVTIHSTWQWHGIFWAYAVCFQYVLHVIG